MATTTGLVTRVKHDGNQVYVVIRTTTDELFYLDLSSGGAGDRATKLAMSALLARCFDRKQAVSIEHSSNGSEIVIVDVKPWDVVQWLDGHPTIAQAVKWQTGYSTSTYDIEESAKTAWPQWTAEMRNDLASAFSSAQQWIRSADPLNNLQETLVYPPVNVGEDVATDTATPGVYVSNTYAWDLYVRWLAQNLLVEIEGLVPWSLLDANPDQLQALLDGPR